MEIWLKYEPLNTELSSNARSRDRRTIKNLVERGTTRPTIRRRIITTARGALAWRIEWRMEHGTRLERAPVETQFNAISRLVGTFKVVSGRLSGPFSFPWCTHTRCQPLSLSLSVREPLAKCSHCSQQSSRLNFSGWVESCDFLRSIAFAIFGNRINPLSLAKYITYDAIYISIFFLWSFLFVYCLVSSVIFFIRLMIFLKYHWSFKIFLSFVDIVRRSIILFEFYWIAVSMSNQIH